MSLKTKIIMAIVLYGLAYPYNYVHSQNLISNPGFESGLTQWSSFWSNDNKGRRTLVTNPVHSGNNAVEIIYPSTLDWAFSTGNRVQVTPGQIYELSCWAKVDTINPYGRAQFSVILYDAANNPISWNYSPCIFANKTTNYTHYRVQFVIPQNTAFIEPRFVGFNNCHVYVDDVYLGLSAAQSISGSYTIENELLKAVVDVPYFNINITRKTNSRVYNTASAPIMTVDSVKKESSTVLRLYGKQLGDKSKVEMLLSLQEKTVKIEFLGDAAADWTNDISFPGAISSQSDEYMVIPRATGIILPVNSENPYGDFYANRWKSTMPFVGVTNFTDGYMIATDDQWDSYFKIEKGEQNKLSFALQHQPSKGKMGYNRTMYIHFVDRGYVEMCEWYRKHAESRGFVKTFTQKNGENPNIDKLIGAVDFWAITFNLTPDFLDQMKLSGVDKAIWNLSGGWNSNNYSAISDAINSRGFLSSRYDIYTDAWAPHSPPTGLRTEGYPQDIIVDANGELRKGWVAKVNDQSLQGYYLCSKTHLDYCKIYLPSDLNTNHYNCRFVDVELASNLFECYSPVHPTTRKEDAYARNSLLSYIKNEKKQVLGVEEAYDFAFSNADYGEGTMTIETVGNAGYDWMSPQYSLSNEYITRNISPAMRVPLHGLTYHDVHIPTWYTGDGASKTPEYWEDKNLWNILYGTMPLYMPPTKIFWDDNYEKFIGGYHLISSVTRSIGYEKMIDHKFITSDWNVQQTTFSNGWKVTANFGNSSYGFENKILAPKGFYATDNNGHEVSKLIQSGDTVDWAFINNRVYLNGHGIETEKNGIRTTGSVFIEKQADVLLVSFIGNQTYVDINPATLPFQITGIESASIWTTGDPVTLTNLSNNWIRLQKNDNTRFYKVKLKPKNTKSTTLNISNQEITISPNPCHDLLLINNLKPNSEVTLYTVDGKKCFSEDAEGSLCIYADKLKSGTYILKIKNNNAIQNQKIIKI